MDAQAILNFIEEIGVLKNLPRTGWRFRGIKDAESVADHCYRVSLLSMLLADVLTEQGVPLNVEKVMRIALLHEVAEARIGDVPFPALEYIPESVKAAGERAALRSMFEKFGSFRQTYIELWEEFEEGTSLEGKLVRAADKLELMLQVFEYEKVGYRSLDKFWTNAWNQRGFDDYPLIREIMAVLIERREREVLSNARESTSYDR
ncbi:HD family hydrolase [Candidatus Poribacteria bacterium]|nr:HD family hydrolase [Candidatus Poribacteria bacterium]